jgi:hypothetical protein
VYCAIQLQTVFHVSMDRNAHPVQQLFLLTLHFIVKLVAPNFHTVKPVHRTSVRHAVLTTI